MNSLHRQHVFDTLHRRFGTRIEGESPFGDASAAIAAPHSPDTILQTGLHECLGQGPGDWPSVLAFALSAAARSIRKTGKPVFILGLTNSLQEFGQLYGFGVSAFGLDPKQVMIVNVAREKELLWAAEEIVSSHAAGGVIADLGAKEGLYGFSSSRRLKLRTGTAKAPIFILRHWSQSGATAAHSRWRIARLPSSAEVKTPGSVLLGAARLSAVLERCQSLLPSTYWEMEFHASRGFSVAAAMADGASRTVPPSRQAA
jgi:protein ImuA